MEKLKVDMTRLNSDSKDIAAAIREIKKSLEKMKAVKQNLDTIWDGLSSEAFVKKFDAELNALQSEVKTLENLFRFEQDAKNKYCDCEERITAMIAEIHI